MHEQGTLLEGGGYLDPREQSSLHWLHVGISLHQFEDCRVLLLVDNMSVCLSFARRRSRNFRVLVQIRRLAAFAMALSLRIVIRWVPSEQNVR